ncbi:MAG: murein biosynthesis integral membrane protein MurJ [Desulfobulbus sp.]|nr:murein biosynthesis integral membrane protein MurJ [Desulfobulbus sp.]
MPVQPDAEPSRSTGKIARSAGAVSIAVMCSRVFGLIREQIFAGFFGAGYAIDAFVVAFRIPNLLRDLFAEGALSAAFVTVFTEYTTNRDTEAVWRLANNVLMFFTLVISVLILVGLYWTDAIVHLLAPDFQAIAGKTELTVTLTRIMFPFLLFVSLAAVIMGILNTKGRFFVPAMSSTFFNLGSIIGGLTLALIFPRFGQPAIAGMAWGTLIGGALQLLMQVPTLLKVGFQPRFVCNFSDPGLRRILLLMLPATIGLSATQINIFVNTNFAASCAEGSVSWLNYAFRLVQLPIGVFGVALSIAVMPVLAKQAAEKNLTELKQTFTSSLILVFALAVPATAGLIMLSEPIIRLIFQHGAFTALDTRQTASALRYYAIGLFAYSAIKVMVPVFYAIRNTRFPVIGSFIGVAVNIITILLVIDGLQHRGIALSTSCAMILNFLFLGIVLYYKLSGYPLGYLGKGLSKILLATGLMSCAIFGLYGALPPWTEASVPLQIATLAVVIVLAVSIYAVSLHILRLPEFTLLTGKLVQRFLRS